MLTTLCIYMYILTAVQGRTLAVEVARMICVLMLRRT
jgi:hypothetical protein